MPKGIAGKKIAGMPVWAVGAAVLVGLVIFFVLRRRGSPSTAVEAVAPGSGGAPPSAGSGSPSENAPPSVSPDVLSQLAAYLGGTLGGVSEAALYSSSAAVQQAMVTQGEIVNSAFGFGAAQAQAAYGFAGGALGAASDIAGQSFQFGSSALGSFAGMYAAIGGAPGALAAPTVASPGGSTVQSSTSAPTKFYTYKADVPLAAGQTLHFTPGKGYYAGLAGIGAGGQPLPVGGSGSGGSGGKLLPV